ncbi:MAG: SH3 domain-containing protein [bacterium]
MTNQPNDKNGQLDLGLSVLLTDHGREPSVTTSPISQDVKEQVLTAGPNSPYKELADQRKWVELVASLEPALSNGSTPEAQLWWVRAHLGALSMPASLLIAPFEALLRDLKGSELSSELGSILKETGLLMLQRIQQVGDSAQIAALRRALIENGLLEATSKHNHRSSWQVLPEQNEDKSALSDLSNQVAPQVSSQSSPLAIKRAPRINKRTAISVGVVALLLLLLLLLAPHFLYLTASTEAAYESFVHEPGIAEQVIPAPEGQNHLGSLSALYYSIKEQEEQAEKISASLVEAEPTSSPTQFPTTNPSDPSVQEGAQSIQVAKRKEQINTRGPIEGEQYRSARSVERERPQNIGEPPIRDRDSSRRTPFERDSNGKLYRATARANVLSAPSYRGRVLGRLEPGDRLLVEGRLGSWIRLRSRQGREGYVLAQSVEEIQEVIRERAPLK